MVNCVQCRRALDLHTNTSGFRAACGVCAIEHMSLGRLMQLSDSRILTGIWNMVQSEALRPQWQRSSACPRCATTTLGVPFRHDGEDHAFIACPKCYLVAMKKPTLKVFEDANTQVAEKRLATARAQSKQDFHDNVHRDLQTAKKLVQVSVNKVDYLLNETPLREIRVTVGIAFAAIALSMGTILLPFASMEVFGKPGSSALLSALTHVTFFQLAWNLLFFLPLSAVAEREIGPIKYALTFGCLLSFSNAIGGIISPFPGAPLIGLSPLIAALIGRSLALNRPMRLRLPGSSENLIFLFNPRTVAIVFAFSELRTMIPTSGGMRWFTLGACVVATVMGAAVTEWSRRRTMEKPAKETRDVVVLKPVSSTVTTVKAKQVA